MEEGKVPLRLHRSFFFFRAISRTSVAAPMAAVADDLDTILEHTGCHNYLTRNTTDLLNNALCLIPSALSKYALLPNATSLEVPHTTHCKRQTSSNIESLCEVAA